MSLWSSFAHCWKQEEAVCKLYPQSQENEVVQNIFCQSRVPFTETKRPSRTPQNQPHTIILPPLNFTLGTAWLVHGFAAREACFISLHCSGVQWCTRCFRLHLVMWSVWGCSASNPSTWCFLPPAAFEPNWMCPNTFDNKIWILWDQKDTKKKKTREFT